jgi:hypothetical protein
MNSQRPILTLAEIEAFDTGNMSSRRLCPLCGIEKPRDASHRSLSLDAASGKWKCFRCGTGGVLREFWRERETHTAQSFGKCNFSARQRRLNAVLKAEPTVDAVPSFETPHSPINTEKGTASANASTKSEWRGKWERAIALPATRGAAYLEKRGLALEIAVLAQTRFHPEWSGHAAVVFPLKNRTGRIIAAQARAISGSAKLTAGPKKEGAFFAPVQMSSGRVFAPLDRSMPVIAITEAPIDALSLASAGFPAIALCGTSGPSWLRIACGLRRVALALDADEAGEKASCELEKNLAPFGAKCERLLPEGAKDWNEMLLQTGAARLGDWLSSRLL